MLRLSISVLVVAALLRLSPSAFAYEETLAEIMADMGLLESPKAARDLPGWQKPKKVVVIPDSPERFAWMKEGVKGVELVSAPNTRDATKVLADADAVIAVCVNPIIDAGPRLKWFHAMAAGIENCVGHPRIVSGDILVTNAKRLMGSPIAEHTFALLLTLTREINVAQNAQRDHRWKTGTEGRKLVDLHGKTILINGLGGIGTDIASRANAFGMKVIATRGSSREGPPYVARVGLASELADMIPEADVIVNAVPLTPETRGSLNAAMFARMKPTAYFINVSRGEVVVTDALIAALQSGKLAGAGIDVIDPEPLPPTSPLWDMPNVVITAHYSGFSELRDDRMWIIARENLRRYIAGDKMLSVVDGKRGY